jgi:hypothetical protein
MTYPYKKVFDLVERKVLKIQATTGDGKALADKLNGFKCYAGRELTDDDYYKSRSKSWSVKLSNYARRKSMACSAVSERQ